MLERDKRKKKGIDYSDVTTIQTTEIESLIGSSKRSSRPNKRYSQEDLIDSKYN